MNEQKRLMLAIVLSVAILFGWNLFFPPPQPRNIAPQAPDSAGQDQNSQAGPEVTDYHPGQSREAATVSNPETLTYKTFTITTPLYDAVLSESHATIESLTLKQYKKNLKDDSPLKEIVSQKTGAGLFGLTLEGAGLTGFETAAFKPDSNLGPTTVVSQGTKTLSFTWQHPDGISVKKILTFQADSYLINCDVVFQNGSQRPLKDSLGIAVSEHYNDEVAKEARFAFLGPIAYIDNEFQEIKPKNIDENNTLHGNVTWAGYTDRYFVKMIVPQNPVDGMVKLSHERDIITSRLVVPMAQIDPGRQATYSFNLYMGPKSLKILSDYNHDMTKVVHFGWFTFLAKPLLMVMNYIYSVIPNYGVAIILLTIIIKLVFWPLGTKSYKSMNEMKKVQPLMTQIREKYKDDKQRMNQEMMSLYKTYKVNPAGGCLPMLVQMPIFFALYRMLYSAIELRHAPFFGWIQDLSAPDRLFHFDFAIPMVQEPSGIPVLTLLMGASFFLQQKMTPATGDPTQAKIMMLMPIFMTVIFINFSSGLVLYMFVNNIISMGQQYYTQKKFA